MGFSAAGFFGQINANITDKKQYIRARVEEDRLYLREQGLKRQAGIQEQRGQYEQAARSLITRGADERRVLTTLEMDPAGLMEVFRRTDKDNNVTGANLNDMMSIAEDYRGEASMDEILNSILPTVQEMPNDIDPVSSRRRSVASWLGLDTEDALSNEVYNRQIVGGMTGDEIMAGMNLPIQAQGSNVGGVNFDFSSLGSDNTISVGDANDYYERANGDYDVKGLSKELAASKIGATPDELEIIEGKMRTLDALPLSGPARLNGIFESGLFPIGDNTRDLMSSNLGPQLFGVENFSAGARTALGFEQTEEEGTGGGDRGGNLDNTDEALGGPTVSTAQSPTERTIRPQARPGVEASIASTPAEVEESARTVLEADPELQVVTVPTSNGSTIDITREELPVLSLEESEDRAAFLAALRSGDTNIDEAIYTYMDKYGLDKTRAVQRMSQEPVTPAAPQNAPQVASPQAPPAVEPEVDIEEIIADREMLQAASLSEDIDQAEFDTILQNFIDKYGLEAARNTVNEAKN
jgi:hypothetical protein